MKFFITGATGLVGTALVKRLLKEGHEVRALVRDENKAEKIRGAKIIEGDLFSTEKIKETVKDVDYVIHLAAMIHNINATEEEYRKINVGGTQNILDACKNNKKLKRLIYSGSVTAYGYVKDQKNTIIDEDYPCTKQNEYGKTKYEGELIIKNSNIPYTILRIGRVYGPGDKTILPLMRLIKKRLFIQVGSGKYLMMPIYIDDLIDAILLAIKKPISKNKTYIIVGEENFPKKRFMELIAKNLNVKLRNLSIPAWLAYSIAFSIEMPFKTIKKEPPISRKQLRFFTESRRYTIEKVKRELGFQPKVKLVEGIKNAVEWAKENNFI